MLKLTAYFTYARYNSGKTTTEKVTAKTAFRTQAFFKKAIPHTMPGITANKAPQMQPRLEMSVAIKTRALKTAAAKPSNIPALIPQEYVRYAAAAAAKGAVTAAAVVPYAVIFDKIIAAAAIINFLISCFIFVIFPPETVMYVWNVQRQNDRICLYSERYCGHSD